MRVSITLDRDGYSMLQQEQVKALAEAQGFKVTELEDTLDLCLSTYRPSKAVRMIRTIQASMKLYERL